MQCDLLSRLSYLIFPKINGGFGYTSNGDWLNKQARSTNVVLIIDGESRFVPRQHDVLGSTVTCQR